MRKQQSLLEIQLDNFTFFLHVGTCSWFKCFCNLFFLAVFFCNILEITRWNQPGRGEGGSHVISCDTGDAFKTKFCRLKKKKRNTAPDSDQLYYELIKRPSLPLSGPPDRKERRRRSEIEARRRKQERGRAESQEEAVTRRERRKR